MTRTAVIKIVGMLTVGLFFISGAHFSLAQSKKTIAVFSPGDPSNIFWSEMIDFGKSVSEKLDIHLLVYHANDNADIMAQNMEKAAKLNPKPDGFIFPSMTGQGDRYIKIAQKHKIPVIFVNMGLDTAKYVTSTRDAFQNLLGQVTPDDEDAGYELAKTLIQTAKSNGKRSINLLAITAQENDLSAALRVKGLQKALKEFPDVKLNRMVNTDWSKEQTLEGLKTEPDLNKVTIVWAASDDMALTASSYFKEKGFTQGKEVFIGGVDWTQKGLSAVKSGELTTSVGGHFAEIGWGLILFYDYFNGKDFESENTMFKSAMKPLTEKNVSIFLSSEGKSRWADVNFRSFSKVLNPNLKQYRFDLVILLRMAKN
jgi:ABC-type sugar transport system substrate-binding protein